MTQNRRKQEKTQNQRRYMDVYSLSGKHENGRKMLEFIGDHNLAGTHNLKKLTLHSDSDASYGNGQKQHKGGLKYIDDSRDHGDHHHGTYLVTNEHPMKHFQDEQMRNHELEKHKELSNGKELSRIDPKKALAKQHNSHTEIEHKIEQTTVHTVITMKERNHVSQSHGENRQSNGAIEDKCWPRSITPSEHQPCIKDMKSGKGGAREVRSLLKQDNHLTKGEILRKQNNAVKDKQKRNCQDKEEAKKSKLHKNLKSAPKSKK